MTGNGWLQLAVYVVVLLRLVKPLGAYMAGVFDGTGAVTRACAPLERGFYRLCLIDGERLMDWKEYALTLLVFNTLGGLLVYALQRLQAYLPLNPAHMAAVTPDSSFNTAVSFVTNTNWQGYGGESTMSYLTQMLALGAQNFLSAATGIAVVLALIRGFRQKQTRSVGNFLGRHDPQHLLRAVAPRLHSRAAARRPRGSAELQSLSDRQAAKPAHCFGASHRRGREPGQGRARPRCEQTGAHRHPDTAAGTGREPDCHQTARH